jgi:tetratricopeptide (TPR) repeat protein
VEKKIAANVISLWVVSTPPYCKVFADEVSQGETDAKGQLELKLQSGIHRILVSREDYITGGGEVEVLPGPEAQQVEFKLVPAFASLNIVTEPPGAEIYFDDVYKGVTNSNGLLVIEKINPGGTHTVRVRKDCYIEQSTPVTSYNGQISLKLLRECMKLKVMTDPPETEIYLDGAQKGTSPVDGVLFIERVNPNQIHTLRGSKRPGFLDRLISVPANSPEISIKLLPDPVVLLVKDIKRMVAQDQLTEAYTGYDQLAKNAPDHPELPRLSESILQSLQARSTERLKQVGYFGLSMPIEEIEEMNKLYGHARRGRVADEAIDNSTKYWSLKLMLAKSDQSSSATEKEALRNNARSVLSELNDRNLRNPYLIFDLGCIWWKLNDSSAAQKQFKVALELKPDWAYPHFALGLVAMNTAENERAKSAKTIAYGQAIDSFIKAIRLKQDFATAYALQCISYASLKRDEEAIAIGLQAVAVGPQNALAHFALGFAYFEKGKSGYRGSLDELNRSLALGGPELSDGIRSSIQQLLLTIKKTIK